MSEQAKSHKGPFMPRSAADPSPSADSTGKRQEDGKETVLEHIGEES